MADFTMTVADILDNDENGDASLLGLDDYPVVSEDYREVLNLKIVRRYYLREIGLETDALFRYNMRRKMHEIMPYYNQLIRTTQIQFDPFETMRIDMVAKGSTEVSASVNEKSKTISDSDADAKSRVVGQEMPQMRLMENGDYATNAQDSDSVSKTKTAADGLTEGNTASTEGSETTSSTVGSQGPKAALLMQYRDALLNVDTMILDDLNDLFMGVWLSHDSYTDREMPYLSSWFPFPRYL